MKITIANLFNCNRQVIVKTYGFAEQEVAQISHFPDFDAAVMYLVKNGYTIKLQDANENGDYSLWFEKIQDPIEVKRLQDERAYIEKMNTLTGVNLDDLRNVSTIKSSQNDEAYTKTIAEKIGNGDLDFFKPKKEE